MTSTSATAHAWESMTAMPDGTTPGSIPTAATITVFMTHFTMATTHGPGIHGIPTSTMGIGDGHPGTMATLDGPTTATMDTTAVPMDIMEAVAVLCTTTMAATLPHQVQV